MATINIYGASDDLIIVKGDGGYLSAEFTVTESSGTSRPGGCLAFSDGTILDIRYTDEGEDGIWRIKPITAPDRELLTIKQAPVDDPDVCSDLAELCADVDWVVYGIDYSLNRH